jgi:hypothetical protein
VSEPTCGHCGGNMVRVECESCLGEGESEPGDLYEEDPLWYEPDDVRVCHVCEGRGGWWRCANTEEWCKAHPKEVAHVAAASVLAEVEVQQTRCCRCGHDCTTEACNDRTDRNGYDGDEPPDDGRDIAGVPRGTYACPHCGQVTPHVHHLPRSREVCPGKPPATTASAPCTACSGGPAHKGESR